MRPVFLVLLALLLAACGSKRAQPTPTLSVDAIFTSAAATFRALQATQLALTPPTSTPSLTPSPYPTLPPPSPIPPLSFGTPTLAVGPVSDCDNSQFVADVTVPDNTRFKPNEKFTKTWLLQNTGTCPWTTGYKLTFDHGTKMGGNDSYLPLAVEVGKQVQVSVDLVAPSSNGDYFGIWHMENDKGQVFGSFISVVIKVGE
jgi:next-to-BRCA1 protein 1